MSEAIKKVQVDLKIAFATSDMQTVDQHFGSATQFAVYRIEQQYTSLLHVAKFGKLAQDGNEDKLDAKFETLNGCSAVYCQAVGLSAMRQLMMHSVQAIKVAQGTVIKDLLAQLQAEMWQGPSTWLAKVLAGQKKSDMSRFDDMEDEGWKE